MKTSVALLFMASGLLPGASPASAASPAYCALYAREYASARVALVSGNDSAGALQRVEDQAYYRCLNLDEEPEFPATSAYYGRSAEEMDGGVGGPFEEIAEGDAAGDVPDVSVDTPAVTPAPVTPAPKPKLTKVASAKGKGPNGSGLTPWTAEWTTWCKAHYRSFNETTGMVRTFSGDKILCP